MSTVAIIILIFLIAVVLVLSCNIWMERSNNAMYKDLLRRSKSRYERHYAAVNSLGDGSPYIANNYTANAYVVRLKKETTKGEVAMVTVRTFPYDPYDPEDMDYAYRCAKELREALTENWRIA